MTQPFNLIKQYQPGVYKKKLYKTVRKIWVNHSDDICEDKILITSLTNSSDVISYLNRWKLITKKYKVGLTYDENVRLINCKKCFKDIR